MQNLNLDANLIFTDSKIELSELQKSYNNKLEVHQVSKSVTEIMRKQIVMMELKSCSNEQYSRREYLRISGLPSSTEGRQLEGTISNF